MSCRLGLWIGESFAEIRGFPLNPSAPGAPQAAVQWLLSKRSLADGLKEAVAALGSPLSGELRVVTTRPRRALERRQGSSPALLVTAGFENWPKLRRPSGTDDFFSTAPNAPWFPVADDQIFGVNERTNADGSHSKPLKIEELDFLVAKFQLSNIKDVAIGFLNSHVNPAHEQQAAQYLRERGIRVSVSHSFTGAEESARWRQAIEAAYVEPVVQEELALLRTAIAQDETLKGWTVVCWGANGPHSLDLANASSLREGPEAALGRAHDKACPLLYFGLENFYLIPSAGKPARKLTVQPTKQIKASAWSTPAPIGDDRGYEPGPMLFGKSQQLTVLDVLYVTDRLGFEVENFTDRISERGRPRILESLYTLGKAVSAKGASHLEARNVAEDIETACLDRMVADLSMALAESGTNEAWLTGPLAMAFAPMLVRRRPDLILHTINGKARALDNLASAANAEWES